MDEEYFINLSSAALIIFKQLTRFSARSFVNLAEFSTRTGLLVTVKFHELSGDIGHFYDFLVHNPFLRQITISKFGYVDTNGYADNFALLLPSFGRNVTEFNMITLHYYYDFSSYANLFLGFENMQICAVSTVNCCYHFNKSESRLFIENYKENWDFSVLSHLTEVCTIEFYRCHLSCETLHLIQLNSRLKKFVLFNCNYDPNDLCELCQNVSIEILLFHEEGKNLVHKIRTTLFGRNQLKYVCVDLDYYCSITAEDVCKLAKEFKRIKFAVQSVGGCENVPENIVIGMTWIEVRLLELDVQ
jgi:hypothetical protein